MNECAERTESLFAAAVALATPEQRAAYLDQACSGDPALRARVEALLRAHDRAGHLLDRPALDDANRTGAYRAPTEVPGTIIAGRYKLLEEIGEGGMGTVWVAEQTAPVRRKVALKLVKPGLDSRSVLARFEAERQALALMDHPNIAKVLDGGLTDAGRPFFVMEYVKGVPITEYCDATRLSVSERLQLFVQVCQAVQHAHQKGIIHRDLKPSNILVAPYDDRPVPKVIDFGLAKAMHQSPTERTLHTAHETVLGTPLYMSPEQAQLNNLDVDTRSDIYSLGVLLYELLTGTTPLDKRRFKEAAWDEVRRIIREEEPPRPSTRLSSTQTLPSLAACRQTEPAKLTKLVRGELDWVVMKALEKDRTRRYETANGFAMDVQRYLAGEAVLAVPPSAGYRLRKFARRYRGALTAAAVLTVALLLALGTAAASMGYVVADRAARRAEAERERVARQAETERAVEEALREAEFFRQQTRSPDALAAARKAEAILKSGEGSSSLRERVREIVTDLEMINSLEDILLRKSTGQNDQVELKQSNADYAAAFRRYGIDVDALTVDEAARRIRARPIQAELAAALDDWEMTRWGMSRSVSPGAKHLQAVARAADPDPWRNRVRDIMSSSRDRQTAQMLKLVAEVPVEELRPVTVILLGCALNWAREYEQAAAILGRAQRRYPDNFWINHDLGFSLVKMTPPRTEEALRYFTAALALRPRMPFVHIHIGHAFVEQGALSEGMAAYRDGMRLGQVNGYPLRGFGDALAAKGELDEAIAVYREAIRLNPTLAPVRTSLANALRRKGALDEAITAYREAIRVDPKAHSAHTALGNVLQQKGALDEAIAAYRESIRLKSDNYESHIGLGIALKQKGLSGEAITEFREAQRVEPNGRRGNNYLAWLLATCPEPELRNPTEAVRLALRATELDATNSSHWNTLGAAHYRVGDWKAAIAALNKSNELNRGGDSLGWFFLAMAHWQLGEKESARQWYDKAVQWMDQNKPQDDELRRFRAEAAELLKISGTR